MKTPTEALHHQQAPTRKTPQQNYPIGKFPLEDFHRNIPPSARSYLRTFMVPLRFPWDAIKKRFCSTPSTRVPHCSGCQEVLRGPLLLPGDRGHGELRSAHWWGGSNSLLHYIISSSRLVDQGCENQKKSTLKQYFFSRLRKWNWLQPAMASPLSHADSVPGEGRSCPIPWGNVLQKCGHATHRGYWCWKWFQAQRAATE